jgi:hypothetical protein
MHDDANAHFFIYKEIVFRTINLISVLTFLLSCSFFVVIYRGLSYCLYMHWCCASIRGVHQEDTHKTQQEERKTYKIVNFMNIYNILRLHPSSCIFVSFCFWDDRELFIYLRDSSHVIYIMVILLSRASSFIRVLTQTAELSK